jgi:hypothetical protein
MTSWKRMGHVEVFLEASVTSVVYGPLFVSPLQFQYWIWGPHSSGYEEFCLMGYETDVSEEHVAIQETCMKQATSKAFFRNVVWLSTDYTALYPRRQNPSSLEPEMCSLTHGDARNLCLRVQSPQFMRRAGFQVITAVSMNITVFCDVKPCSFVDCYQHFWGSHCVHLQRRLLVPNVRKGRELINWALKPELLCGLPSPSPPLLTLPSWRRGSNFFRNVGECTRVHGITSRQQ